MEELAAELPLELDLEPLLGDRVSITNWVFIVCFFFEYFLVHFLALALCFSSISGFYSVFNAFPMELVAG